MVDWGLVGFVKRSKQRQLILKDLGSPKTPTEIYESTSLSRAHVSRTLKEFTDKGLIKCLTPEQRMGKIYRITKKGEAVLKELGAKD